MLASDDDASHSEDDEDGSEGSVDEDWVPSCHIPLGMWELNQTDTKRDTGAKLRRFKLAKKLPLGQKWQGVVLSPNGKFVLSPKVLNSELNEAPPSSFSHAFFSPLRITTLWSVEESPL